MAGLPASGRITPALLAPPSTAVSDGWPVGEFGKGPERTWARNDDVEYLKGVAEHHAGRQLRRHRWRPKSMYNGQEAPLWMGGRGWSS